MTLRQKATKCLNCSQMIEAKDVRTHILQCVNGQHKKETKEKISGVQCKKIERVRRLAQKKQLKKKQTEEREEREEQEREIQEMEKEMQSRRRRKQKTNIKENQRVSKEKIQKSENKRQKRQETRKERNHKFQRNKKQNNSMVERQTQLNEYPSMRVPNSQDSIQIPLVVQNMGISRLRQYSRQDHPPDRPHLIRSIEILQLILQNPTIVFTGQSTEFQQAAFVVLQQRITLGSQTLPDSFFDQMMPDLLQLESQIKAHYAARLTKEQLAALEKTEATGEQDHPCNVCLENFEKGKSILILKCKHFFHSSCLGAWLQKNSTCPTCRNNQKGNKRTK